MNREREERLQIMLTMDELRAVDDFRYKTRMPSRAAAVRELLNRGLRSLDVGVASTNSRSKDFGVLEISNGSSFETEELGEPHRIAPHPSKRPQR
ncbi:MAG: hypothetical protein C0519_07970 [Hyphomicrobium sp.]|jgi:hypothetical protein|nr:hypothetical protein [Hyphomicrobium sp.]PPD06997.1 MAG: hypothetical protein CTY28_10880 [Hyphomicrobium sp.]